MTEATAIAPFFILGCVRSGTTILRDVLRSHPLLFCPEETHIYRWAWPYGSEKFHRLMQQGTLQRHHEMNGLPAAAIQELLQRCHTRREFLLAYMEEAMRAKGLAGRRWFEKTPQHIYGAFLLAEDFPEARFLVLQRAPLKVAASLKEGRVMEEPNVVGAANYWREAVVLGRALQRSYPKRVLRVAHSALLDDPAATLEKIAAFLAIPDPGAFNIGLIDKRDRRPMKHLTEEEAQLVRSVTQPDR